MSVVRKILQTKIQVLETAQNRWMVLSNFAVCRQKKSTFIEYKELNYISND